MIKSSVEPWIEGPIRKFVEESGVILALLLHPTGQVMGQHGFVRATDIMSACALAAAIHASATELGRQVEGKPFRGLHHPGTTRQIFLAETPTARGPYILLTVFNEESSFGLVRMFFDEFRANLASAAPPPPAVAEPVLNEHFERDLNHNLAALFGRA